jgi:hypothetical protein
MPILQRMHTRHAACTDVGRVREHNEDSHLVEPELRLYVVADGMGGHAHGEVASRLAVETIEEFIKLTSGDTDVTWPYGIDESLTLNGNRLKTSIRFANQKLLEHARTSAGCEGMATTVVAVLVSDDVAEIAHVGDSRLYLLRNGEITRLTSDVVVEADIGLARRLSDAHIPVIWGDCATPEVLEQASVRQARLVVVAVPDESSALLTVTNAVRANPVVNTVVRGRTAAEIQLLHELGAHEVVVPELEGGLEIMRQTLLMLGFDADETLAFRRAQRDVHYGEDVVVHH